MRFSDAHISLKELEQRPVWDILTKDDYDISVKKSRVEVKAIEFDWIFNTKKGSAFM
jgi:hypothetical protein